MLRPKGCILFLLVRSNDASGGISWKEHNVKLSQILGRNERTHLGSETIWKYAYNNILKKHIQKGNIIDDVNENL